jgi:hypothetical protein
MKRFQATSKIGTFAFALIVMTACSSKPPNGKVRDLSTPLDDASANDDLKMGDGFDSPDGGTDGGVSREQACVDYATNYCNRYNSCDTENLISYYGSVAACIARNEIDCASDYFSLPGTSLTPERWEACAQAYVSVTCDQFFSYLPIAACNDKPGTLAANAACAYSSQCQSANCVETQANGCGSCETISPNGGACTVPDDCALGSTCNAAGTCVAYGQMGASCDANHPCDDIYNCDSSVCVHVGEPGDPCTMSTDCRSYVDCIGNVCVQGHATALPGAACGELTAGQPTVYCKAGICDFSGGNTGNCIGNAADGAACNPSNNSDCVFPASCEGGVCVVFDPTMCE